MKLQSTPCIGGCVDGCVPVYGNLEEDATLVRSRVVVIRTTAFHNDDGDTRREPHQHAIHFN